MKVKLSFIDDRWCGEVIDVDSDNCIKIDGESAMNMLFEQQHGEHCNIVIFYKREDLPTILHQADGHLSIDTFASEDFSWYFIYKDFLKLILDIKKEELI